MEKDKNGKLKTPLQVRTKRKGHQALSPEEARNQRSRNDVQPHEEKTLRMLRKMGEISPQNQNNQMNFMAAGTRGDVSWTMR